ncbi:MAG: hypothetical protein TEF_06350 [Rhizobiales bacterium NRL2]|jgi:hypothetical protein|nr:MAG: hypothetical protein TEF_06350 [Rhizobiales bacterium NRL2]
MAIDRDALIDALERMGDADDAAAAAAGREAQSMLEAAELSWDEIIDPKLGQQAEAAPKLDIGEDDRSVLKAIDALLARPGLYEGTAEDLREHREELERGELDPEDRRYILTLYERVA